MQMTIYDAATVGSRSNCVYPNPVTVTDADTMRQAAAFDHVCAAYKQNYRSVDNFLKADCLPMDCDNDHSDDPDDWLTPFDVAMDFPGVGMIFVYSKSHMKQKGKRGPRPRFHVYFICTETTNSEIYSSWKDRLIADYPYFDDGAKDSARFLFGVKNAVVEVYDGEITIDEFLADSFAEWDAVQGQIPEGSRNKTMSHYAGRIIKRLGNTEEAHKQFLKEAEKCSPPLDDAELAGIWASAVKFGAKVAAQEGYIPPEQYNQDFLLMPEDFSDVGQANTIGQSLPEITIRTLNGTAKQQICRIILTEEEQMRVETIHSVKGGTFDAVLLLSSPDGRGKTGFWESWLDSEDESGRIGYVASTRPRYLLCWGVKRLTDVQRRELEKLGLINLNSDKS